MLILIIAVFVFCFALERAIPGWRLPHVRTWPVRVVLVNAVQLGVVLLAGVSWECWLSSASVFHLSQYVPPWAGGLIAYFVATFVFYWWHRMRHESDLLWRLFHQIHHSPQRIEVITSFYKHPGEMLVNSILGSLLVYTLLGLSPQAGAVYTACTALGEFFYHASIRTPRWVGYFFQRPEMHRIHHRHGYHRNNYGDIVWWDMLFGTYENPSRFDDKCGFDPELEERLPEMLCYRDVHREGAKAVPRGLRPAIAAPVATLASLLEVGDLVFIRVPALPFREVAAATGSWTNHVGIVVATDGPETVIAESTFPVAKQGGLARFLARSEGGRVQVSRLNTPLSAEQQAALQRAARERTGILYDTGFDLHSRRQFCSRFAYEVLREATGIEIGQVQNFAALLEHNPQAKLGFWKFWYFGRIPWQRETVTPTSVMQSHLLHPVFDGTVATAS